MKTKVQVVLMVLVLFGFISGGAFGADSKGKPRVIALRSLIWRQFS